jgi:putative transcriptional regulator
MRIGKGASQGGWNGGEKRNKYMTNDYEKLSAFEQIKLGLQDGIAHSKGELTLRTFRLPPPPPPMDRGKVIKLRKKLSVSQAIFAALLNVSPKAVQTWELGRRSPRGGTLRLLQILDRQPGVMQELSAASSRAK